MTFHSFGDGVIEVRESQYHGFEITSSNIQPNGIDEFFCLVFDVKRWWGGIKMIIYFSLVNDIMYAIRKNTPWKLSEIGCLIIGDIYEGEFEELEGFPRYNPLCK